MRTYKTSCLKIQYIGLHQDILVLLLNGGYFYSRTVSNIGISVADLCYGFSYKFYENKNDSNSVRPIVTLKSNAIDLSIKYEKDNIWRLK